MFPLDPALSPPRTWWQRNWSWFVIVGFGMLALVAFAALIVNSVVTTIRHTDIVQEAVARAKASPQVQAELGAPVHDGWWVRGTLKTGPSGYADLAILLKGTKKDGTLYVVAHKSAGRLIYDALEVGVEGRQAHISLLVGEPPF